MTRVAADGLFRYEHRGLLGTVVDVRVSASDGITADLADQRVADEIRRLERTFSAFDEASELCRWRRGGVSQSSPEFAELLGLALDWQVRSEGRFNPMIGEVSALWAEAERCGVVPDDASLAAIVASIQRPRFEMVGGEPRPCGDCSAFNLNAFAKGFIVDRSLDTGLGVRREAGVRWISVNAGGDLAHRGSGSVRAGVENPHRPYDNEPPLDVFELSNAALATSGFARRGFRVGERWFGHVLDPRTGRPVEAVASISVLAADTATADVLATVAGVMSPGDAVAYIDRLDGVEAMVIDGESGRRTTQGWPTAGLR